MIGKNGEVKGDDVFGESIVSQGDFYHQMFIIWKYVLKKAKSFQTGIAPYVNIKKHVNILNRNKYYFIDKHKLKVIFSMKC